jgi:hypothetical protein
MQSSLACLIPRSLLALLLVTQPSTVSVWLPRVQQSQQLSVQTLWE